MRVLSLFDGISCARVACERAGIEVEKYYASEIDKYAISINQNNYPDTVHVGSVVGLDTSKFNNIDLLIGGSPCQGLSIAKKNREGLKGSRSGLFYEYIRILNEAKPKYFILENVASMPKEAKKTITEELFGIEPIMIDAALVSAQQRKRLFWVGRRIGNSYEQVSVELPEDRKIYLQDILQEGEAVTEKAYCLTANQKDFINDFVKRHQGNYVFKDKPIKIASIGKGGQGYRMYSIHRKSICLSENGGGLGAKTGLYLITGGAKRTRKGRGKTLEIRKDGKSNALTTVPTDSLVVLKDYFRSLSPVECERLQSLPDGYTEGVSNTQRKKALGNAFNVDVVAHIIRHLEHKQR
jgi:DNA (cytosine-5)-methyltransferase 3A